LIESNCPFCQIVRGAEPAQIVYQDDELVAFRDRNPVAPTHILIIPRRHVENVRDAKAEDAALLGRLLLKASEIAEGEGLSAGFRLVTNTGSQAGQSVYHFHLHLLGGRRMSWPPG
jgi:histidine triad (HIT) family protein